MVFEVHERGVIVKNIKQNYLDIRIQLTILLYINSYEANNIFAKQNGDNFYSMLLAWLSHTNS